MKDTGRRWGPPGYRGDTAESLAVRARRRRQLSLEGTPFTGSNGRGAVDSVRGTGVKIGRPPHRFLGGKK